MGENHIYEGQIVTTTPYKNWYWYFESLFWPEQIMRIKEICGTHNEDETLEVAKHVGAKTDDQVIKNIRNNKVSWHDSHELYGMVRPIMAEVNQASGWNFEITAIEPIQYTVYYGDENHYHWHTDTIINDDWNNPEWLEETNNQNHVLANTMRKISCSIHLSDPDDYDGGEFELLHADSKVTSDSSLNSEELRIDGFLNVSPIPLPHFKDKGSALFFPSFTYHRVKPVTRGIRRSLVVWFRGPQWR